MLNTFCVQNVCCNIFYLSAGGIAGAARKISPKASGATTPAKGIAGKVFFRTCYVLPLSCTHLALWRGKAR